MTNRLKAGIDRKVFQLVHENTLIYNTCWEDPACDRAMMQLNRDSSVVMLTSAGCNALDYALDHPAAIHAIDMNPRQNALLELKLAGIKALEFEDFFQLFGEGFHANYRSLYTHLKEALPSEHRSFWDKKFRHFFGPGVRKSFYTHGATGTFAWLITRFLKAYPALNRAVHHLLQAPDLATQQKYYQQLEPMLFNRLMKWTMNQHLVMCLLGVPESQQDLLKQEYQDGVVGFIQEKLRQIFFEHHLKTNYFWSLYLRGAYSRENCPNYLKQPYFNALKAGTNISTHTQTISEFLTDHPGAYTHFVLLDHQDWLAHHAPEALEEEWRLILKNAAPGAKILLRSAASKVWFIPSFAKERMVIHEELAQFWHQKDRVGTYGCTYFAILQ
jgi:S-adenosylmethionine-diacylglycerol 3-amino-3-carboxypropyl transferase